MITLSGKPKSTNHLYGIAIRGNRPITYMTNDGKATKEQYYWEAKAQWKKEMLTDNVKVEVALYFPDKRRRDIDNYCKILLDSLEGIVYKDDKQISELKITKDIDVKNPRIEVKILSA